MVAMITNTRMFPYKHLTNLTAKIEELHQAFQLAEVSSPGITDLLVSNMISKLKSV